MARIRCRNGETFPNTHTHASVAEVRQCQGAPSDWKRDPLKDKLSQVTPGQPSPAMPTPRDPNNVYVNPKGISAQLAAFRPLDRRDLPSETGAPMEAYRANPQPRVRVDPELESAVPPGRYAVEGDDGVLKFYKVDKPQSGTWAGRTFVSVQASDDWHPVRYATARAGILRKISADVKAAAIRYGKELGVCSVCGRTLTNPESIAAGIGPVCEGRL